MADDLITRFPQLELKSQMELAKLVGTRDVEIAALRVQLQEAAGAITALQAELGELTSWKASALASLMKWHALGEELQKHFPLTIGDDIPSALNKQLQQQAGAITALQQAQTWQPIETAPFMQTVVLWAQIWRQPFVGLRNGDNGACYIDTPRTEAHPDGWQTFATHWMPLPSPPASSS